MRRGPDPPRRGPPARTRGAAARSCRVRGRRAHDAAAAAACATAYPTPRPARLPRRRPAACTPPPRSPSSSRTPSAPAVHPGATGRRAAGGQPARSATPRRVLADVAEGVRSTAERDAKRLLARSGLPEPWWNVAGVRPPAAGCSASRTPGSTRSPLTWEINSYAWHLEPRVLPGDHAHREMTAANVIVLRCSPQRCARRRPRRWPTLVAAYARRPGDPAPRCGPTTAS